MIWLQDTYLDRVSGELEGFVRNGTVCNFRCPMCGDSKRDKTKRRGYLFAGDNGYRFFCHNCQASMSFYDFLRTVDADIAKEFIVDKLRDERGDRNDRHEVRVSSPSEREEITDLPGEIFIPVTRLPSIDPVKRYIASRMIPRQRWGALYAAPHFLRVGEFLPAYADRIPNDNPRLILPIRNVLNHLVALSCRALDKSEPRYMMMKVTDEQCIFGIETVRFDKTVYVVEGPIDSLFLPNCVAVTGTDLPRMGKILSPKGCVLVYDNQPRNAEVVEAMRKAADKGFRLCVWPRDTPGKDINEMILNGWTAEKIVELINERAFEGLRLETEIAQWKRIDSSDSSVRPRKSRSMKFF